ncbi:MAG: ATP synthase F1 subunit epsilon, partial [Candidatus Moranbacteria bacterium]|nr:ATP synthase F1 subunit epsilon [Candidatus Moranbacteria bacterium]
MKGEKSINFKIVTPEKTVFEDRIYQVTLPVSDGDVTILPDHRSYIASLKSGEIVVKTKKNDAEVISLVVAGGFVEFHKNNLVVLADNAERTLDLDMEKIEEARKRAEDLKKNRILLDENEYAKVLSEIE